MYYNGQLLQIDLDFISHTLLIVTADNPTKANRSVLSASMYLYSIPALFNAASIVYLKGTPLSRLAASSTLFPTLASAIAVVLRIPELAPVMIAAASSFAIFYLFFHLRPNGVHL